MWPSEYEIAEHRKDMERVAAQNRLIREARSQPPTHWFTRMFSRVRFSRPQCDETPVVQPRSVLRRVS